MKLKPLFLLLLIASIGSSLGCQLTPTFTTGYQFEKRSLRDEPIPEKLAVVSFEENREDRYHASTGRVFLTYVPFIPYITIPYERLEETVQIYSEGNATRSGGSQEGIRTSVAPPFETYYYPNSFPEAVANDLGAANLFESVNYIGEASSEGYRYVLSGALHSSELRTSMTSFGLGAAGVLLWYLPIPMSKTTGGIDVDLVLMDQQSGEVIWQKRVEESLHRYYSMYTSSAMAYGRGGAWSLSVAPPPSDSKVDRRSLFSWHFEALRRVMHDAKAEIAEALARSRDDADPGETTIQTGGQ